MNRQKITIEGQAAYRIKVEGHCAVEQVEDLRTEVKKVYEEGIFRIAIDFKDCDFIDSTGLGALVSIHKKCMEKGYPLVIESPSASVMKLLTMTRLDQVFDIN